MLIWIFVMLRRAFVVPVSSGELGSILTMQQTPVHAASLSSSPFPFLNIYKVTITASVQILVLRSSLLTSLQLIQVPPAYTQAALVRVHARPELLDLAIACGAGCV